MMLSNNGSTIITTVPKANNFKRKSSNFELFSLKQSLFNYSQSPGDEIRRYSHMDSGLSAHLSTQHILEKGGFQFESS